MQQHLHQLLDTLRTEVDNKACQKSVEDLSCTIDNLTEDYLLTRNKVKISSEFVDWFTQRGEAYEHNMSAVDNHLKQLGAESKDHNYLLPPHSRKHRLVLMNMRFQTVILKHSKTFTFSNYLNMYFLNW